MSSPSSGFNSEGEYNNNNNAGGSNDRRVSPHHQQTYANRAASAIKASGALARFGKVLYGGGNSSSRDGSSGSSYNKGVEAGGGAKMKNRKLKYRAKSDIVAMGQSSDKSCAAISGKDFFQILNINDEVSMAHDLRGNRKQREVDKMLAITSLKWGYQSMLHKR